MSEIERTAEDLVKRFYDEHKPLWVEYGLYCNHRPYKTMKGDFNQIGKAELTWDGWLYRNGKWHIAALCLDKDIWVHMQSIWTGCDDRTLPAIFRDDMRIFGGARVVRLLDMHKAAVYQDVDTELLLAWTEQVKTAVVVNPDDLRTAWKDYEDDEPLIRTAIYRGPAYVYLMHDPDSRRYKIGVSVSPPKRLPGVQSASGAKNLYIVAATPGTYADEQAAHRAFAHRHLIGEWFEECEEIAEWARNGLVVPSETKDTERLLAPIPTPVPLIVPELAERRRQDAIAYLRSEGMKEGFGKDFLA